jgi:hypothetical protein
MATIKTIKKIKTPIEIGIQKGANTHNHDHVIYPVNLSVMKIRPRIPKSGN